MFDISPIEWTAIPLSLRVALVATLVATPIGIARGMAAGATYFPGQIDRRGAGASAAGAAAGRHRLSVAADIRPARPGRRVARRPSRHRVVVSLDRRGTGLRHHVVSTAGAADAAVDRGHRPPAGAGRGHARRGTLASVSHRHAAAGAAGRARRHGARLRQGDRRIRRDHHLRLQHSRRNPDHFLGDLFADPDAGRRSRAAPAGGRVHHHRHRRADRLGMVRAARDTNACMGTDHAACRCLQTARGILDRSCVRQRGRE